jgi:hypothetical protein
VTDWLARQCRGVIDFRLDTDDGPMTSQRLERRIGEYYAQLKARDRAERAARETELPFDDPLDF